MDDILENSFVINNISSKQLKEILPSIVNPVTHILFSNWVYSLRIENSKSSSCTQSSSFTVYTNKILILYLTIIDLYFTPIVQQTFRIDFFATNSKVLIPLSFPLNVVNL